MSYKEDVLKTSVRIPKEDRLLCSAFGLCAEAGEVADHLKKSFFHGHSFDRINFLKKCGDVRWYLQLACNDLNITLENKSELSVINYDENTLLKLALKLCKRTGWCADHVSDSKIDGLELNIKEMEKRLNEIYACLIHFSIMLNTTIEEIEDLNIEKLKIRIPDAFES